MARTVGLNFLRSSMAWYVVTLSLVPSRPPSSFLRPMPIWDAG
jgi:hypothetical protein